MRIVGCMAWALVATLTVGLVVPDKASAGSLDGFVGGLAGGMLGAAIAGSMARQQAAPRYYAGPNRRRAPVRREAVRSKGQPFASSGRGSTIRTSADPFAKPQQPVTVPVNIQQQQ